MNSDALFLTIVEDCHPLPKGRLPTSMTAERRRMHPPEASIAEAIGPLARLLEFVQTIAANELGVFQEPTVLERLSRLLRSVRM